jgi:hypothetical protein
MAHYAFLDANNIVTEVIVGRNEYDLPDGIVSWEEWYGNFRGQVCKRTSFNTFRDYKYNYRTTEEINENGNPVLELVSVEYLGSKHRTGGTPFRGQYASIGDFYDADLDEFVTPAVESAPE